MQKVAVALILLGIIVIAAPLAAVAIVYRDNLGGLVVPPEVNQLIGSTALNTSLIQPPQLVNSTYNQTTKTYVIVFNFTNPLNLNVTINAVSANITCTQHNFTLTHVALAQPVKLDKNTTANITIVFSWTADAETHIPTMHAQQETIPISITNIVVDISGITLEVPTRYDIGNLPLP